MHSENKSMARSLAAYTHRGTHTLDRKIGEEKKHKNRQEVKILKKNLLATLLLFDTKTHFSLFFFSFSMYRHTHTNRIGCTKRWAAGRAGGVAVRKGYKLARLLAV